MDYLPYSSFDCAIDLPKRLGKSEPEEMYIVPIPSSHDIKINYEVTLDAVINMYAIDGLGIIRKIFVKNEFKKRGHYQLNINIQDIPNGVYQVVLSPSSNKRIRRFVKI